MSRVAIELTTICDGRCRFCGQRGLEGVDRAAAEVEAEIRTHARAGRGITFVGGEPTRRAELAEWIASARGEGAAAVGIATHARGLGDPSRARELVDAGLTDAHVSIHGARAEVHDYHVDAPGSWDASVSGLTRLRELGASVVVNTVVTRSSFRVLGELVPRLRGWGVSAWCLSWLHARGGAAEAFDRLVPRFGLAAPFVLHAIATARRQGLPAFAAGLPTCVLGPMHAVAVPTIVRSFASDPCTACPARPTCSGVDARYLDRFGPTELHTAPPVHADVAASTPARAVSSARTEPRAAAAEDSLAALFVGVGRLAPEPEGAAPESPARARARLPVLGRPDPAAAEVRGRTAEAGDALKSLFPRLFEKPEP